MMDCPASENVFTDEMKSSPYNISRSCCSSRGRT
jgi:hypothetical protein